MESKETRVTSGTKMSFYGTYLLDAAKREAERKLLLYCCLFDFLLSSKPNQDDRTRPAHSATLITKHSVPRCCTFTLTATLIRAFYASTS